METGLTKNQMVVELTKSPHGKLAEFIPVGQLAAQTQPEFLAHLIAWNRSKGQVRDSKIALPVVSLTAANFPAELLENSLAHLSLLNPRELLKAYHFALDVRDKKLFAPGRVNALKRLIRGYLREREKNVAKFERTALQHRAVLKELYTALHIKPADSVRPFIGSRAFGQEHGKPVAYPAGSLFEKVAHLQNMSPLEAAGTIMENRIPFLVALGALGAKAQEPDLVLALINRMTPTELVTNTKMLEGMGVKTNPALRGAFQEALERAAKSGANLLKTTQAAEAMEDEGLRDNLRVLQDKQIEKQSAVEGRWLVLGDKSSSMSAAIELAKHVAAVLAKMAKGKVFLVYFDTVPQGIEVTGKSLDEIKEATKYITANGWTSIGCGLLRALEAKEEVDGIAIVSDGGENRSPIFAEVYKRYSDMFGKQVPVYFYQTHGDTPALIYNMDRAGIDMQVFDLRGQSVDYYSLPNLVNTMRTNRYSLVDEIMDTRLLKLADIYKMEAQTAAA